VKKNKKKKEKDGVTPLSFTYEDFKEFCENAYGWGHTKKAMPFRKILTDFKGQEYVEGDILKTTPSERKRMKNGLEYDCSFRLGFETDRFGLVEFIINCDYNDKILNKLLRGCGLCPYNGGFVINDDGWIKITDDDDDDE